MSPSDNRASLISHSLSILPSVPLKEIKLWSVAIVIVELCCLNGYSPMLKNQTLLKKNSKELVRRSDKSLQVKSVQLGGEKNQTAIF